LRKNEWIPVCTGMTGKNIKSEILKRVQDDGNYKIPPVPPFSKGGLKARYGTVFEAGVVNSFLESSWFFL
jgi:hypothetical protein